MFKSSYNIIYIAKTTFLPPVLQTLSWEIALAFLALVMLFSMFCFISSFGSRKTPKYFMTRSQASVSAEVDFTYFILIFSRMILEWVKRIDSILAELSFIFHEEKWFSISDEPHSILFTNLGSL